MVQQVGDRGSARCWGSASRRREREIRVIGRGDSCVDEDMRRSGKVDMVRKEESSVRCGFDADDTTKLKRMGGETDDKQQW